MRTDYERDELICGDPIEMYELLEAAEAKLEKYETALNKLARLGNGKLLGNSIGNMIAREAILEDKL